MAARTPITESAATAIQRQNAGEVLDELCRFMGLDPQNLPDADSLPPWTDEDAAEFKRLIYEACKQADDPAHPWPLHRPGFICWTPARSSF